MPARLFNVKTISIALVLAVVAGLAAYRYLPLERTITYGNGQSYRGTMKNGKYHGHGTLTYPDDPSSPNMRSYSGDFVDGAFQGRGTMIWQNGDKYVGEFHNSNVHGRGVTTYSPVGDRADMLSYDGDYVNGASQGQGTMTWRDGEKYEGQWHGGQMNGRGVVTYGPDNVDGLVSFEGDFKDGQRHGRGTMIWRNGTKYEGRWRDGQINGRGLMTFAPGNPAGVESYEGDFVNARPSGWGTMKWIYGIRTYEGQWKDGLENGRGTLTLRNGRKYEGTWREGRKYNGAEYDADGREVYRVVEGVAQKGTAAPKK